MAGGSETSCNYDRIANKTKLVHDIAYDKKEYECNFDGQIDL